MNVYDFDNTIYDGESVVDFYLFCARKKPSLIKYFPLMLHMLVKYKLGLISISELENKAAKYALIIFSSIDSSEKAVSEFWDKNEYKIKDFYKGQQREDDIIISASCSFLLYEICRRLWNKKFNMLRNRPVFRQNKSGLFPLEQAADIKKAFSEYRFGEFLYRFKK